MRRKIRKGAIAIVVQAIVALLIISIVYVIGGYIYEYLKNTANDQLSKINMTNNASQATLDIIDIAWKIWPLPLIIGIILWVIVASQRKEYVWEGA